MSRQYSPFVNRYARQHSCAKAEPSPFFHPDWPVLHIESCGLGIVLRGPDSNLCREVYVLADCNRRPAIENAVVAYDASASNCQVPGVYNFETGVDYHSLGYPLFQAPSPG
jgi:hypothetical protein